MPVWYKAGFFPARKSINPYMIYFLLKLILMRDK